MVMNHNLSAISDRWDEEYDVVVVGFGCAGACAAIEACDSGARVLVIDRFKGGGATVRSGGVIYAGGGSAAQLSAGFKDSAVKMFRYLEIETGGSVDRHTLRDFCSASLDTLVWLKKLGVSFPEAYYPGKTTQPPGGFGLYYSGNERQFAKKGDEAPRGHVPLAKGMSGSVLYEALKKGTLERGAEVRYRCKSKRLVLDEGGSVVGIEILTLPHSFFIRVIHSFLFNLGFISGAGRSLIHKLESRFGIASRIRARGGVVISSGGFIYNREMVRKYAPDYAGCMPLGTPGDDGSGIDLGQSAGGTVDSMGNCAASRFICPPEAFVSGILLNLDGMRFCDETLYGASISRHISKQPQQRAYLVIDSWLYRAARQQMKREERLRDSSLEQILSGEMNALIFRKATAFINMSFNRKKARSTASLERKCGMPAGSLERAIRRYNGRIVSGYRDEFGKAKQFVHVLAEQPFYAIDCRLDRRRFPSPCLTLGGLSVAGLSSQVLRRNGSPVPGLYSAGRSAAGVCSHSYVSGLSIADCIYSGRRAGKSAALAVRHPHKYRLKKDRRK
jgi:3-oxo-5alpha-steroid 4-dehydrogenase